MLADTVHVTATSTQPMMKPTDTTGIDDNIEGFIKFAGAVDPGSAQVIGSIGDERYVLFMPHRL